MPSTHKLKAKGAAAEPAAPELTLNRKADSLSHQTGSITIRGIAGMGSRGFPGPAFRSAASSAQCMLSFGQ